MTIGQIYSEKNSKIDNIRDCAAVIFLRDGYSASSTDDIAKLARASKGTIYRYFPDKTRLFREAMHRAIGNVFRQPLYKHPQTGRSRDDLVTMFDDLAHWAATPAHRSLLRVAIAESERFPDIHIKYIHSKGVCVVKPIEELISKSILHGTFKKHDFAQASRQFVAMIMGQVQQANSNIIKDLEKNILDISRPAANLFFDAYCLAEK